jgi:hypothetical protein
LHSYFRVELSDEQLGNKQSTLLEHPAPRRLLFRRSVSAKGRWSDHVAQARSGVLIPKKAGAPPELRGNIRSISRLFSPQLCPLQCTWNGCLFRWPQPPDGVGFVAEKRTSAQGSRCAHSIVCLAPGSLWLFANLACSPTTITTNTIPNFVSLPSRP